MRQLKATMAICLLALSAAVVGGAVAAADADLQLSAEDVEVKPGETTQMNVTVANEGSRATGDSYVVAQRSGSNDVNLSNETFAGPIQANETINLTVNVTASEDVEHGATTIELGLYSADGALITNTTTQVSYIHTDDDSSGDGDSTSSTPQATENTSDVGGAPIVAGERRSWIERKLGIDLPSFDWIRIPSVEELIDSVWPE
ncbi:MAG: hypothetical protein ABEH81_04255 [Halopenitus sp.]